MTRENIIVTYGGGEVMEMIFQGVAMLFGDGTITQIIRIASIVGGFWAIISIITRNNVLIGVSWFLWFLLATELLFLPKTTVFIHDPVQKYERHVANVPFGLAFIAGMMNGIGGSLTKSMEKVFTLPDDLQYHKHGLVFGSKLMSNLHKAKIVDVDFERNMHKFVNQCIVYSAMVGHQYTIDDLRNTNDIWQLVKSNAHVMLGFLYHDPDKKNPSKIVSCKDGADLLEKHWQDQIGKVAAKMIRVNLPDAIASFVVNGKRDPKYATEQAKQYFLAKLTPTFNYLTESAQTSENILRQELMINAIVNGTQNKIEQLGGHSNYSATKALLQQRNTHSVMGSLAKNLPLVKVILEGLCYGAFIFIVLLSLMPGGYRVLFSYFQVVLWLQLWAPLNAILNLIITVTARVQTSAALGESQSLTLANSAQIISINTDLCTTAMYFSMLIPMIAAAVVRGGVASFSSLASGIARGYQSAAASASSEVTSGSFSLANVSHRALTYDTATMFQHSASPYFNAGHYSNVMDDGTIKTTNLDGTNIFRGGAGTTSSVLNTNVDFRGGISSELNKAIAREDALAIQQSSGFNKQLQEKYGFDTAQRAQIMAGISAGFSTPDILKKIVGLKFGIEGGVNYNASATKSHLLSDIASYSQSRNLSKQNIDRYTKARSFIERNGTDITQNWNQEMLEWMTKQPINHGPTSPPTYLSIEEAAKTMNKGGSDAQLYAKGFIKYKMQEVIQSSDAIDNREKKLDGNFAQSNQDFNNKMITKQKKHDKKQDGIFLGQAIGAMFEGKEK